MLWDDRCTGARDGALRPVSTINVSSFMSIRSLRNERCQVKDAIITVLTRCLLQSLDSKLSCSDMVKYD